MVGKRLPNLNVTEHKYDQCGGTEEEGRRVCISGDTLSDLVLFTFTNRERVVVLSLNL